MLPASPADRAGARRLRTVAGGPRSLRERDARCVAPPAKTDRGVARMVRAIARAAAAGWTGEIHAEGKNGAPNGRRLDDPPASGPVELPGGRPRRMVAARD